VKLFRKSRRGGRSGRANSRLQGIWDRFDFGKETSTRNPVGDARLAGWYGLLIAVLVRPGGCDRLDHRGRRARVAGIAA